MVNCKVSVIIPAYNAESTIKQAIESVPSREGVEILVVDDGSTDNTAKVARDTDRVGLIILPENKGVASAVNCGLNYASGEYVVLLGSDDDFYTQEFETVMEQLDGTDLVYFDLRINDGTIIYLTPDTKQTYCGSTKFMRREFIADLREPEDKRAGEDWFFYQEILKKNPTEKFTSLVVKHYNFPREGSLSWQQRNGLIK
jgi:glycosyltransferase involved in cell wall biosynthesis